MKNYGFIRVAAAVPTVKVADTRFNTEEICRLTSEAFDKKVSLVAFPELSLTGYTCGDLFHQEFLVSKAEEGVRHIAEYTRGKEITVVAGAPVRYNGRLYNCAVVIRNGSVKGIVPKTYIPASEARWFASGAELSSHDSLEIRYAGHNCIISPDQLFKIGSRTVAIELGHDLWSPVSPSTYASLAGAQVVVNLSADNETASRNQLRKDVICNTSLKNNCAYIYCSCGFGESTQDLVYAGAAYVYENGAMIAEKERYCTESSMIIADVDTALVDTQRQKNNCFKALTSGVLVQNKYRHITVGAEAETDFEAELARDIEPHPFTKAEGLWQRCEDITAIQVNALAKRLSHIGCKTAIIGISGGLDSTLALLVTVLALTLVLTVAFATTGGVAFADNTPNGEKTSDFSVAHISDITGGYDGYNYGCNLLV